MTSPISVEKLTTVLRGLLIAEICFSVIGIPLSLYSAIATSAYLENAGIVEPELSDAGTAVAAFSFLFVLVFVPCLIVSWIGLFNFWGWSRWLYLATNVAGILLTIPFSIFDFSFQWGLPTAILDIGQPITGAIAAIIFLSPLGNRFAPAVHSNSHAPKS